MAYKRFKIRLLPVARQDLFEVGAFIAADSPQRALDYLEKIHSKMKLLSRHPKIGSQPRDRVLKKKGYRVLVIDSYLVFYVIRKGKIQIRRILHGSRDLTSVIF